MYTKFHEGTLILELTPPSNFLRIKIKIFKCSVFGICGFYKLEKNKSEKIFKPLRTENETGIRTQAHGFFMADLTRFKDRVTNSVSLVIDTRTERS
jgi:hypothetical protein